MNAVKHINPCKWVLLQKLETLVITDVYHQYHHSALKHCPTLTFRKSLKSH